MEVSQLQKGAVKNSQRSQKKCFCYHAADMLPYMLPPSCTFSIT